MKYKVVDLFCGAGGFSKGFEMSNKFKVIRGYDIEKDALKTFNFNHPGEGVEYDVRKEVPAELKQGNIDVVIGSPPCQGFSDAKGSRSLEDERNNLVFHFIRWVKEIEPQIVVMENVSGMLTIDDRFIEEMKGEFETDYNVIYGILNSKEFGVPQKRERAIFIATRKGMANPTLPDSIVGEQLNLFKKDKNLFSSYVTVGQAISDLSAAGEEEMLDYKSEPKNKFQEIMRAGSDSVYNHIAKAPRDKDMFIVEKIPEGKMYRSTRFGDKYVGVWDLFKDKFTLEQRLIFWFIGRHRGRKAYKLTDKSGPDYIPEDKIVESLQKEEVLREAMKYSFEDLLDKKIEVSKSDIRKLKEEGWLRTKEKDGVVAYDLNSKSGIRPRYMRLNRDEQSNTILTTDFNAREKLHPVENRGLSLREGARIQSFPDDFIFQGDFKAVAKQVGNAVPPLLARGIADHVVRFLERKQEEVV
ncbi:DNA cytosine methyltransferase [Natroniella acetigena]|uniref:DNA cytosine methyltransferase n=1 Tax=Natroniella acetigena TaxID=52004 RepID=UPI00200A8EC8|nr:DNA cytosine methyltransferase [Natroniella acetigena]MCK8828523.1 DNA cytosine methyltransferase [Natroniella acetigena]